MPIQDRSHNTNNRSRIARSLLGILLLCSIARVLVAQPQPSPINWNAFQFLMGEWIGEGTGATGEGTGGFTFSLDLQNTILVRKNFANYPAQKGQPAFTHNDLMIVYQEAGKTQALYFDNERHVINYAVSVSRDSSSIIFVSNGSAAGPRFRLTNTKDGANRIKILFEIAPPGKPDAFSKYIEAFAHRK